MDSCNTGLRKKNSGKNLMVQAQSGTTRYHLKKSNNQTVIRKNDPQHKGVIAASKILVGEFSGQDANEYGDLIEQYVDYMQQSSVCTSLLKEIEQTSWQIEFEDTGNKGHCLDFEKSHLKIDQHGLSASSIQESDYFFHAVFLAVIRGLRDIWQEQKLANMHTHYCLEAMMFLERLRAADNDVFSLIVAWEFKENGYDKLWRHIATSDNADLVKTFMNEPGHTLDKAAVTFRAWFESDERVRGVDHESLEYMDTLIEDMMKSPFGKTRMVARDIERIACLPMACVEATTEKNHPGYLNGLGHTILQDPFYSGIQDPVNQAHLFHLARDAQCITINGVQFRDSRLARMIFPEEKILQD